MTTPKWTFRVLAAVGAVATVALAPAPRANAQPKGQPKAPAIIVHPQINAWPGIPAAQINAPAYNPGPYYNPALNNPYLNQVRYTPVNPLYSPNSNPFNNPFAPVAFSTPPIAIQQPGQLMWRGPDLQVNPTSGLIYKPLTGVARTTDGSIFYHVPNTGLPTVTGAYAPGTGLYYDPRHNTFLNPASGVISRPGTTNVFLPWIMP